MRSFFVGRAMGTIIVLIIVAIFFFFNKEDFYEKERISLQQKGHKNASYMVEGGLVLLRDGQSEVEAESGMDVKIITRYFGNEARGDLNADGKEDIAFILTQSSGGTGTFYYVVAALKTDDGYIGTNAILIGDRIAPQTTEIRDGQIIVNYAVRASHEPMAARPSIGTSKYLKIFGSTLMEVLY